MEEEQGEKRHCLNSSQKLATHTDSDVFYVKRKRRRGNVWRAWIPLQTSKKHLERMHPSHVTQYDEFVAGSRKRKKDDIVTSVDRVQRNDAYNNNSLSGLSKALVLSHKRQSTVSSIYVWQYIWKPCNVKKEQIALCLELYKPVFCIDSVRGENIDI